MKAPIQIAWTTIRRAAIRSFRAVSESLEVVQIGSDLPRATKLCPKKMNKQPMTIAEIILWIGFPPPSQASPIVTTIAAPATYNTQPEAIHIFLIQPPPASCFTITPRLPHFQHAHGVGSLMLSPHKKLFPLWCFYGI
jgi:hypothetical protein